MKRSPETIPPEIIQAAALFMEQAKNDEDKDERTALDFAAAAGNIPAFDYLAQQLDISKKDYYGRTPMHFAARNGKNEMIHHLFTQYNLRPAEKDEYCSSPLHEAAGEGHYETVRLLIETYGLSPADKNYLGHTALHMAAAEGHCEVVRLLIETYKLNLTEKDNIVGSTALHLAVYNNQKDMVRLLLKYKNEFNLAEKDNYGFNALYRAVRDGHEDIVRLLLEDTDKFNPVESNDGMNVLDIAAPSPFDSVDTAENRSRICNALLINFPALRTTEAGKKLWRPFERNIQIMPLAQTFAAYQKKSGIPISSDLVLKIASFIPTDSALTEADKEEQQQCLKTLYNEYLKSPLNPLR